MKYIRHNTSFQLNNTAIALGKFDGLHQGHRLLLDEIKAQSRKGLSATVFTFDVSPVRIVKGTYDGILMTSEERERYFASLGIDVVVEYPFTYEFSQMEPEVFVKNILVGQMGMRFLAVGEDFRFGRNQKGNVELLGKLAEEYGFNLKVFEKLKKDAGIVSATRIKACVKAGEMELVAALMGHPYEMMGSVIAGKQIGRTMAYPTANIPVSKDKILPPFGVYIVRMLCGGQSYNGIANLGVKPTVEDGGIVGLETFLFDFQGDLYGQDIVVQLLKFVRPEKRFQSREQLSEQIAKDVAQAEQFFTSSDN